MVSCPAYPLAASVDTATCATTSNPNAPEWPHCCTTTAIPFSRCYGSCSAGEAVVLSILLYVSAELTFGAKCWTCTCACGIYLALHMAQRASSIAGMQVMQGTLCITVAIFAASHPGYVLAIWLSTAAAIAHAFFAVVIFEVMRLGDCRACLQEAHACKCGRDKDPIPPGALHALQISLARKFRLQRS